MQTEDGPIGAERVVLAGGAWTAQSAEWLGAGLPIYPLRGQILAPVRRASPRSARVIFGHDIYLAPKADGSVVIGATYERVGFDDRLTAAGCGLAADHSAHPCAGSGRANLPAGLGWAAPGQPRQYALAGHTCRLGQRLRGRRPHG